MGFPKIRKLLTTVFILPTVLFLTCTSPKNQFDDIFLIKNMYIDILVNEFLERNEFTGRPINYPVKKTTLNDLLPEKNFVLKTEQNNNDFINPAFQVTLENIIQKFILTKLHPEIFTRRGEFDFRQIQNTYELATQEDEVEFCAISGTELIHTI